MIFGVGVFIVLVFSGVLSDSSPLRFLIVLGVAVAVLVIFRIGSYLLSTPERRRFERLKKQGVLLDGSVERATYKLSKSTRRDRYGSITLVTWTRTLNVRYAFANPSGRRLTGMQSHIIDKHYYQIDEAELLNEPFPPKDTPIRVLYLDEDTYVML